MHSRSRWIIASGVGESQNRIAQKPVHSVAYEPYTQIKDWEEGGEHQ